jgi:hypothetical protein
MDTEEIKELVAALACLICIVSGVVALFRGLKQDGFVDLRALTRGTVKTGGAGILLLCFGTMMMTAFIIHEKGVARESFTLPDGTKTTIIVDPSFVPNVKDFDKIMERIGSMTPIPHKELGTKDFSTANGRE